jgi:hypothetical protein
MVRRIAYHAGVTLGRRLVLVFANRALGHSIVIFGVLRYIIS